MITRSLMLIMVCSCFAIFIQTKVPKAIVHRSTPNIDEFMIEDKRTHTRQNYVVQRGPQDAEILRDIDNVGPPYETESSDPETSPEELPALIVDYANMIRNDIILLDKSVETRTRKRGNNQIISEPPCFCNVSDNHIHLGDRYYPSFIANYKCVQGECYQPYGCKPIHYSVTALKWKVSGVDMLSQNEKDNFPSELYRHWVPYIVNVTTGCICTRDSIELN